MSEDGLVCAFRFDPGRSPRRVGWLERPGEPGDGGWEWVHLDLEGTRTRDWLRHQSGLDEIACEALDAEETRPRATAAGAGHIVILRGVNLNAGQDPEDMVSVRLWVDERRVITLRSARLMAIQDVRSEVEAGKGPGSPGDFLVDLAARLIDRMAPVLEELFGRIDQIEEQVIDGQPRELRERLGALRRQAIALRRYIAPDRDVITQLQSVKGAWLTDLDRLRLREIADRLTRYVEDLDSARERAAVTQEELAGRVAEQMNRTMYVLSVVAGIFLPLGLLTGLLGINVGGIPGANYELAFVVVCVLLLAIAGGAFWVLRRFRLF